MYFAFKRIVLSSALLFQMHVASMVAIMYLHRVFLRVNRFVILNKQIWHNEQNECYSMNYWLWKTWTNELLAVKNMNYCNKPSLFVIFSEVCALLDIINSF